MSDTQITKEFLSELQKTNDNSAMAKLMKHILVTQLQLIEKIDRSLDNFASFQKTLSSHESKINDLENQVQDLQKTVNALKEKEQETTKDIVTTRKTLEISKDQISYLNQYRIDKDVFLSGFPIKTNSEVALSGLSKVFGFSLDDVDYHYDFTRTHPVSKKEAHFVVIGFCKRKIKTDMFNKKKEFGQLHYQQIVPCSDKQHSEKVIFLMNRLTTHNLMLHRTLVKLKNDGRIHNIVYKNCRLHIGSSPSSKDLTQICNLEELRRFFDTKMATNTSTLRFREYVQQYSYDST
jgi:hypothetical protein